MQTAILARHAESVFSVRGAVNGDPRVEGGLTDEGRRQAQALGQALAGEQIDLCVTSEFERTRATADAVLAGRDVPRLVLAGLNDIRFGQFEGRQLEEYRGWARTHGPADDCPGGGESRLDAATRYTDAFAELLARPEGTVLVIAHGLPIRYVLDAADGLGLTRTVEPVEYAEAHRLSAEQLGVAVDGLRAWIADPVFA